MIEQELFKVCPECDGEYRHDIERCADCGVPLAHPEEIAKRDARQLRPSQWLVILRTAPILWVRALAGDLDQAGIRYRIDRRRARDEGLLTLAVRWQDRQAAKVVDEARLRLEDPRGELSGSEVDEREARRDDPSFKVCPRCGSEYRLDATSCADCGSALIFPDQRDEGGEAGDGETETAEWQETDPDLVEQFPYSGPADELAPSDDLACVCCRYVRSVQSLSQALDQAEIPHRLDPAPFGSRAVNCLYVMPADGDRAAAIDASLWQVPLDEGDVPVELTACPACGAPHALGVSRCGSCGLVLGAGPGIDQTCSRCGAVIGVAVLNCPNCAERMPPA